MTQGLLNESDLCRRGDVGVFEDKRLIHLGARPRFVPQLTEDLFAWAKETSLYSVLKSAILHYY